MYILGFSLPNGGIGFMSQTNLDPALTVGGLLAASARLLGIRSPIALQGWGVFNVTFDVTRDHNILDEMMRDPASEVELHARLSDLRPRDPSTYCVFLYAAPRGGGESPLCVCMC
jgi:hypothetical protein